MPKLYVCGRCGYRAHHRIKCQSCGFKLEEECAKCYNAQGNCICRFHSDFIGGKHTKRIATGAAGKRKKGITAAAKIRRKKRK